MKEYLAELVRSCPTPTQARNAAREYLQARLLGALQRAGAMIPLAFHGGTALHFLYVPKTWISPWKRHKTFMISAPICAPSSASWPPKAMLLNSK